MSGTRLSAPDDGPVVRKRRALRSVPEADGTDRRKHDDIILVERTDKRRRDRRRQAPISSLRVLDDSDESDSGSSGSSSSVGDDDATLPLDHTRGKTDKKKKTNKKKKKKKKNGWCSGCCCTCVDRLCLCGAVRCCCVSCATTAFWLLKYAVYVVLVVLIAALLVAGLKSMTPIYNLLWGIGRAGWYLLLAIGPRFYALLAGTTSAAASAGVNMTETVAAARAAS